MQDSIRSARAKARMLRFRWTLQAFAMHRLQLDNHYNHDHYYDEDQHSRILGESHGRGETNKSKGRFGGGGGVSKEEEEEQQQHHPKPQRRQARGIGKIGGLPLPHAGPELYGVLPPKELQSALRLVASLTSTAAQCLGILLPHPILLRPSCSPSGDIVNWSEEALPMESVRTTTTSSSSNQLQNEIGVLLASLSSSSLSRPVFWNLQHPNAVDHQSPRKSQNQPKTFLLLLRLSNQTNQHTSCGHWASLSFSVNF